MSSSCGKQCKSMPALLPRWYVRRLVIRTIDGNRRECVSVGGKGAVTACAF